MMNSESASFHGLDAVQMHNLRQRALRFAREECPEGSCSIDSELIHCVDESVTIAARDTSITTYIPVLAVRRVHECIVAGTCDPKRGQA